MNVKTYKRLLLAATVICLLNLTSCSKYEDGPALSLKFKTSRLIGTWQLIEINDMDVEDTGTVLEFDRDGDFTFKISGEYNLTIDDYTHSTEMELTEEGNWEWNNDKSGIKLNYDNEEYGEEELKILRLTNKELWVEDLEGDRLVMEKE